MDSESVLMQKCACGSNMVEVIGYNETPAIVAHRAGWLCVDCGAFDKAIGRERIINEAKGNNDGN